jgi:hypothetical protein
MNNAQRLATTHHGLVINAEVAKQLKIANYLKMAELTKNKFERVSYMNKARDLMRE